MKAEREAMKDLSRRKFIRTAAAGAGVTACAGIGSGEAKAILPRQVSKWEHEAAIVVLGTGAAGFVAAITAHDQGSEVLILEKASEAHSGGNTRVSGQGVWCPSDDKEIVMYQRGLGDGYPVPDDVIQVFHEYMVKNREWLQKMNFEMSAPKPSLGPSGEYPEFPGSSANGSCVPATAMGFERLWKVLKDNVLKRKINIMYETPGIDLIQDPQTREIQGVVAEKLGRKIYIKARKAVVLCTGGFENNQEMIRDYLGMPCGYPKGSPYNTGDGIKMAQAVGADLWHMDNQAGPDLNFKAPGVDWAFGYRFSPRGNGWIWVAKDATRFTNEAYYTKHGKIPFHGTYVPLPTPLPVHVIFDETMRKSGPLYPPDTFFCWYSTIEHYRWSADSSAELSKEWILRADTVNDLAKKIGKNADVLEKTVAAWNGYCAAGKDSEYDRPAKQMAPIQTPPYYAMEFVPTFTNTQGGPRRNKYAQVLDTKRRQVPRLYSAGELGSIFSWHYQGGGNLGECIATGRIAGEHAAAEKPWS
jgi:succinate dehydrogenase/fumarate reductase flavoprotein subunit